jgi:GDP-L-fucose synthase
MLAWLVSWISMIFVKMPIPRKTRELLINIIMKLSRPVMVTGGSGLVGQALKELRPDWIYVDSKMFGSLTKIENVQKMFDRCDPCRVVHLASNNGGILKNPMKMFEDNLLMDANILGEASRRNTPRVINILSTVLQTYRHPSNEAFAQGKQFSEFYSKIINKNTKTRVTCLYPPNIYGPGDNFSLSDGAVIPALIHRAHLANRDGKPLEVLGSGKARRQFMHAKDFARIIVWAVEHPRKLPSNITCCEKAEYSIDYVASLIAKEYGLEIEYAPGPDGQDERWANPSPINFPKPEFTIETGIVDTVNWFKRMNPY